MSVRRFLPAMNSRGYHLLLAASAIFIMGPLGGISAAYMNFSIGIYVAGQVLAGILGSAVTLPYGPEGKHGANYIQTMAASVAGMCAMAPLIQAMLWLGLPMPPAWQLVVYFMCIGMFGVGVGMLYTPIVVDRLQLTYPSGLAVANILRALTDPALLKRSIAKLGGSILLGFVGALGAAKIATLAATGWSASTLGGGMIVGARIAIPSLIVGLIGAWQTPYLIKIGWLTDSSSRSEASSARPASISSSSSPKPSAAGARDNASRSQPRPLKIGSASIPGGSLPGSPSGASAHFSSEARFSSNQSAFFPWPSHCVLSLS
jgi:uncharacterized oligopeptide transporter (OPT) family protein